MSVCTEDPVGREKASTNNIQDSTETVAACVKPSVADALCVADGLDTKQDGSDNKKVAAQAQVKIAALNLHKINTPEAMGEALAQV